jgi:protein-S-isoprenylcysteine O-methyltransferase Ste14
VSVWRHARAIGLLPFMATLVVPAFLVWRSDVNVGWGLPAGLAVLPILLGLSLVGVGVVLFVRTVALFATIGQGTLAPWDPTSRLVLRGPYRHVRNPMISGVLFVLLGEAAVLGSPALLIWAAAFIAVNAIYMPIFEEPGLKRRFGEDYEEYAASVPRWFPRLRPWDPLDR